jgi:septal ring factor EnvC (AmiA/AmiB activator)
MSQFGLAKHIANRLALAPSAEQQYLAAALRELTVQVESLERSLGQVNAECIRLANARDELQQKLAESEAMRHNRRTATRKRNDVV